MYKNHQVGSRHFLGSLPSFDWEKVKEEEAKNGLGLSWEEFVDLWAPSSTSLYCPCCYGCTSPKEAEEVLREAMRDLEEMWVRELKEDKELLENPRLLPK
jgi:hypothetical protein